MTLDERVEALARWRLTPRQARFVVTVALHSGYCLRRQYLAFAGVQYGKGVRDFLDGLVARRLAGRTAYRVDRGYLYHVHARPLYSAIGQEDSRHRRRTSAAVIARRLMVLDCVIAESSVEWFATEGDKVALFTQQLGVPLADLPQRSYAAHKEQTPSTTHFFPQKWPVYLAGEPTTVHFVTLAIDPTGRLFEQFLREHGRLLSHLSRWAVVALTPARGANVAPCRAAFDRYVAGLGDVTPPDRSELFRYFRTRQAVECNDLAHVSVADLEHYRNARSRFADPIMETRYARWLVDGERAFEVLEDKSRSRGLLEPRFIVRELPFTYEQFGDLAGVC